MTAFQVLDAILKDNPEYAQTHISPGAFTQWLLDLRSGEFVQGKGCLNRRWEQFCCLGVYAQRNYEQAGKTGLSGVIFYRREMEEYSTFLSNDLIRIRIQCALAQANDHGHTFSEIADWIEANLRPLAEA